MLQCDPTFRTRRGRAQYFDLAYGKKPARQINKPSASCPPATLPFLCLNQVTRYALFATNRGCLNPPLKGLVAEPHYFTWTIHLKPNRQHLRKKHPTCDQPLIILEPGALPPPSMPESVVAEVRRKVRQKYDHWR